ncbi:MAG: hypothetical protein MAG794_00237 [Gammaproteobacteria bacterium]|nr:hypothetical protein [Gammaproteobacteria bacterium]
MTTNRLRLTPSQQTTIRELARRHFGDDAEILVFGSRSDGAARGGDLDLYIETDLVGSAALKAELAFRRALQERLGEQRLDASVHSRGEPLSSFEQHARTTGVRL